MYLIDQKTRSQRGQALVIVMAVLGMLFVIALAFLTLSNAERTASIKNIDALKARYITESGVNVAKKVLQKDAALSVVDSSEDLKFTFFSGSDVDSNGDGIADARWIDMLDSAGTRYGRFSVHVMDEASKVNVNSCSDDVLKGLISGLGLSSSIAEKLLSDRPFNALEEIAGTMPKEDYLKCRDSLTVYSRDYENDLSGMRRTYINGSGARSIAEAVLAAGIPNPFVCAAHIIDSEDTDLRQTLLDTYTTGTLIPSHIESPGGWKNEGDYYTAQAGSSPGTFIWSNLTVEDGQYYCYLFGTNTDDVIGDVSGQRLISGEGIVGLVAVSGGQLSLTIAPAQDASCRFSHIQLASLSAGSGLTHAVATGTESIVINELMVKPSMQVNVDAPILAAGQQFSFLVNDITPGYYYVRMLSKNKGGPVGTVTINDRSSDALHDGEFFPFAAVVGSDRTLRVQVKNNSLDVATLAGVIISQQPDAEYIELVNLSDRELDIGNFSVEVYSNNGEVVAGWPARIPVGKKIGAHGYMVLAVDRTDADPAPSALRANSISLQQIWQCSATQLDFSEYGNAIDRSFDLLPDSGAKVILKDTKGSRVDAVEYNAQDIVSFKSIERGCPAAAGDKDGDGFFDNWYQSENASGATPGQSNQNAGMRSSEAQGVVVHLSSDCTVPSKSIVSFSDFLRIPTGVGWNVFTIDDVGRLADHFSFQALDLPLAGHMKSGDFVIQAQGVYGASRPGESSVWSFDGIPAGSYAFSIIADESNEASSIKVGCVVGSKEQPEATTNLLFTGTTAAYGIINMLDEANVFQVKLMNESTVLCAVRTLRLEPVSYTEGRINVNTATERVLHGVLSSDALVSTILGHRPLGNQEGKKRGIGDLLILDPASAELAHLLTVKSDVYEILSRGEYLQNNKTSAYQTVRTVIEQRK